MKACAQHFLESGGVCTCDVCIDVFRPFYRRKFGCNAERGSGDQDNILQDAVAAYCAEKGRDIVYAESGTRPDERIFYDTPYISMMICGGGTYGGVGRLMKIYNFPRKE